ncbi:hypothetical protein KFK09_017064 [Dendrobium nobile]|uniref:Uncharacterized protein n=1 Tax=Dendrobium nobile TaxID=94219 RepID=A0A8T3B1X9_DENNO|nr:hypothetical protein KFK09_017064 [Dendrobium nobile]
MFSWYNKRLVQTFNQASSKLMNKEYNYKPILMAWSWRQEDHCRRRKGDVGIKLRFLFAISCPFYSSLNVTELYSAK